MVTETSAWCRKEAQMEPVNKRVDGLCTDQVLHSKLKPATRCSCTTESIKLLAAIQPATRCSCTESIKSLAAVKPATRCSLIATRHSLIGL